MSAEDLDDGGALDPTPADKGGDDNADELAVDVTHQGKTVKMAPVSTLIEHRRAARDAGQKATAAETENAALKATLKTLQDNLQTIQPQLQYLRDHPQMLQQGRESTRPSGGDSNTDADPEMVELAKAWELYDADGKPDAARAGRIMKTVDARVEKRTGEKMAPVVNAQLATRAGQNLGILESWAGAGHCSKEGIDKARTWLKSIGLPDEMFAHDGVRDMAYFLARGMAPGAAAQAAGVEDGIIVTETAGGRRSSAPPPKMPAFSARVADRRGKSISEWSKLRETDGDVLE